MVLKVEFNLESEKGTNEMYKPIACLLKYIFKTVGKVEVQGKEKLPKEGPYVVACTHTSFMDVLMLATGMYPTEIHYMAKKELFEKKFLNWFFKNVNAFPVDRANPGPSTLKIPSRLLKRRKSCWDFSKWNKIYRRCLFKGWCCNNCDAFSCAVSTGDIYWTDKCERIDKR